jgi:hypothetical protein
MWWEGGEKHQVTRLTPGMGNTSPMFPTLYPIKMAPDEIARFVLPATDRDSSKA